MVSSTLVVPSADFTLSSAIRIDVHISLPTALADLIRRIQIMQLQFACRYQIQALWANALLSVSDVWRLVPTMECINEAYGEISLTRALRGLIGQLSYADYLQGGYIQAKSILDRTYDDAFYSNTKSGIVTGRDEILVHRVAITPTGTRLYGPEVTPTSRVLRKYRCHTECFLRVTFGDEDEDRLLSDRDVSNDRILGGRFLSILKHGLEIAGEMFYFFGFSHSSLRSRSCWFMKPFSHEGVWLTPSLLIAQLGNFDNIRCPAKYAARIGQKFSDTSASIEIDPSIVTRHPDVRRGGRIFTDGCGTISPAVWKLMRGNYTVEEQSTLYQIRYQGAKGMISVDSRLQGNQMRLRESMIKFEGSPATEIEICGSNARAMPFTLNKQIIKILEDLEIKADVFEDLQVEAVEKLRSSATTQSSAVEFIGMQMGESATGLHALLVSLAQIDFDIAEDSFLRDILGALLQTELRDLKYRARIPVPQAVTLYGISDESDSLKGGEIFVTFEDTPGNQRQLTGPVAITRSPALYPGDIQKVNTIIPATNSHLRHLRNCVVFSQKGTRDLPSMLSGGDLDGDLYNIIYDQKLVPKFSHDPSDHSTVQPRELNHPAALDDIAEFFVDFMQNDQLGRIAMLHQAFADDEEGSKSKECKELARLHSIAVDFSMTGIKVEHTDILRGSDYRPDFMAPSASVKIEKEIKRAAHSLPAIPTKGERYVYYESDRVLGRLYRAIDEDLFFKGLEDDTASLFNRDPKNNALEHLLKSAKSYIGRGDWRMYVETATEAKNWYDVEMLGLMSQHATRRAEMLTEKELWIGKIVGRSSAGHRKQHEQAETMKLQFERVLKELDDWLDEKADHDSDELLCLAVACLHVAVRDAAKIPSEKIDSPLKGFGWFAAGLCLPEFVRQQHEEGPAGISPFETLQLAELNIRS